MHIFKRGDIVAWGANSFNVNQAKIIRVEEEKQFCFQRLKYAIFTKRLSFPDAREKCFNQGGRLVFPTSDTENEKVLQIVKQHKDLFGSNVDNNKKAIWLGAEKTNGVWYDLQTTGRAKPLAYSKWRDYYNTNRHNYSLCPFMFHDGTWGYLKNTQCKFSTMGYVCSFAEIPIYNLKGQNQNPGEIERSFYMSIDDSNLLIGYEGISRQSKISLEQERFWHLNSTRVYEDDVWMKTDAQIIGRRNWTFSDEKGSEQMVFSTCTFGDEYTCNSGHCVDMSKRCDHNLDCSDRSDEFSCSNAVIPLSYIKQDAPSVLVGKRRELRLAVRTIIETLDMIDTIAMKIGLTMRIEMKWKDHRLQYKDIHHHETNTLSDEDSKKLWLPMDNAEHVNAVLGKVLADGRKRVAVQGTNKIPSNIEQHREDFYYAGDNSTLTEIQKFQVLYNCHFNLQKYPFDIQNCLFGIDLKGKDDELFLFSTHSVHGVLYNGPKDVGDFIIEDITNNITNCTGDKWRNGYKRQNNQKNPFILCISMRRSFADQMIAIFCPSILFWIIAYCTMFLRFDDVSNRSRTTVTILLVLIALLQTVKKDFPKTTYYKFIDLWFLWYTLNIFLICIYHIMLPVFHTRLARLGTTRMERKGSSLLNNWENTRSKTSGNGIIKTIDLVLLFAFPTMMIAYNVLYFYLTM